MSFNLDDPLADILSDGSDDSFFDDDILGKKKPAKKKETPKSNKKNNLFDFDDLDKPKKTSTLSEDKKSLDVAHKKSTEESLGNSIPDKPKTPSPAPFRRAQSKDSFKITSETNQLGHDIKTPTKSKMSTSADKLDILSEFGSQPKTGLDKGKSSQSLLDDILGGSASKTGSSNLSTKPVTAAKNQDLDLDSILGKSENKSKSKPAPKTENVKKNVPTKKKGTDDWLGVFKDEENEEEEDNAGMPSWLGGGESKKKTLEVKKKQVKPSNKDVPKIETDIEEAVELKETKKVEKNIDYVPNTAPEVAVLPTVMPKNSTEDLTTEGAAMYLQQQESQLMIALQLKAQEDKLAALQVRQKESQRVQREAALAQHSQLDLMLQKQAEHRHQMQAIIATHQDRISQRIKALLGTNGMDEEAAIDPVQNGNLKEDCPQSKERKQLLQLVQSLQENHDKEIDLMETSYRRQLAFLEVSIHQSEERMKEESEKLVRFYTEKINWLEEHHEMYKKLTDDNLTSLTERHKNEKEMIREQHMENIKVIQEHHVALMENIKNAVIHEQALIKDSSSFSADLHELVADVKENRAQCQVLVEKIETIVETNQKGNDRSIQLRETCIHDMIEQMKKEKDSFEQEKAETREMIKMLENRLKQMTTMIEDETAALKQKKMEFEFDRATFNKQTEFAKNVLKKQDEEMKSMREDIQKEYQEKISNINDEKQRAQRDSAAIAKEKASIMSLKQELEKTKAELQAQLEELTEGRSRLNVEKQQLHMEEQRILAKSRDLDLLAKSAVEKQSQAEKKYSEAEFIQRKYEDRIRRIQEHVVSLNAREKQIAKEKVALSRERLNLHNEKKQIESRQQCSLCRNQQSTYYNYDTYGDNILNVPVSRDYTAGNVNSVMSNIEQEMAHVIGRGLSFRHSMGDGNIGRSLEDTGESRDVENLPSHVESATFKDYMDPKFMMLRMDVQQVISAMEHTKKDETEFVEDNNE